MPTFFSNFSATNTLGWVEFQYFFTSSIISDLNKFIKTADNLSELIADFNDFDSNSHTEYTLDMHSEKITELWVKVSTQMKTRSSKYEGPRSKKKTYTLFEFDPDTRIATTPTLNAKEILRR